jgi:hypothetical protein
MLRAMRTLALLALVVHLSGCITYYVHSDRRDSSTEAQLAGIDVVLGAAGGLGWYTRTHKLSPLASIAVGIVTAFAVDGVFALIVSQADKKE